MKLRHLETGNNKKQSTKVVLALVAMKGGLKKEKRQQPRINKSPR